MINLDPAISNEIIKCCQKYNEFTLLDMDIINLDSYLSESLMNDILQDGYILYQKGPDNESKN